MAKLIQKKGRIFILGISSYLGYNLAHYFRHRYSVVGSYFTNPVMIPGVHTFPMDLKKKEYLDRLIRMLKPDFTIAACGLNNSRLCAENIKLAEIVNALLPLELAQSAIQNSAKNIYLSCSQVFDGTTANSTEKDKNYSALALGRTKLTGESYIRAQTMENTTIRFGKVIGTSHYHRKSYFDFLRNNLNDKKKHFIREDKTYNFLSIQKFCETLRLIIESEIPATHRIFHIGGVAMKEIEMNKLLAEVLGADPELVAEHLAPEEDFEGFRVSPSRNYTLDDSLFQQTYNVSSETLDEFKLAVREQLIPYKNILHLPLT